MSPNKRPGCGSSNCRAGRHCIPDGRGSRRSASLTLTLYPGAETLAVDDATGAFVGVFVGAVVDIAGKRMVRRSLRMAEPIGGAGAGAARRVESFIETFGGSWVFVSAVAGLERVYLDANGTATPVFDTAAEAVAATTGLLLDDDAYRQRFDATHYAELDVAGEGWIPGSLTAHRGVNRLLANHYLDLNTWRAVRHWPRGEFKWTNGHPAAQRQNTRNHVRRRRRAIADGRSVAALTGGRDSRFVLAALRPHIRDIDVFTFATPTATRDVAIARQVAAIAGVEHRALPYLRATEDQQRGWHYRVGHTVTGANMTLHPSLAAIAEYSWFLGGLGGETGRGTYWRPADSETTRLDARRSVRGSAWRRTRRSTTWSRRGSIRSATSIR